jgi:uncharacterized protein YidB (DUF937 family)
MGLLDSLMQQAGGLSGLAGLAAKNPRALAAAVSLLSTRDQSVGGVGGLGGVIEAFTKKGLGDMVSAWVATGPNPPVSAGQVSDVLGKDILSQFAAKAGVPQGEAGGVLASLLPAVIDHLTPQGSVPGTNALESALGGLLAGIGK